MKVLKSLASHAAVFMRSCLTSSRKRVYNLVSRMIIEVESAHLVVHLLQRSTLHGINLRKKLWKCSQRSFREDNSVKGVLFYKFKVLVCCTRTVPHNPVGHTGIRMLSPVPIAPENIQKMKDWLQTFWCCGASDGKSLNSPVAPQKKKKTDEEENDILEYDSLAVMKSGMRSHVMMITLSLERETHYPRKNFPALEEVFVSTANCVQLTFRNFPCYGSNGIAVTFFLV